MAALKRMAAEALRLAAEACDLIAEGLDPTPRHPDPAGVLVFDHVRGEMRLDGQVIGHG